MVILLAVAAVVLVIILAVAVVLVAALAEQFQQAVVLVVRLVVLEVAQVHLVVMVVMLILTLVNTSLGRVLVGEAVVFYPDRVVLEELLAITTQYQGVEVVVLAAVAVLIMGVVM
jgi:hypothetical protein